MGVKNDQFEVRQINPESPFYKPALHRALNVVAGPGTENDAAAVADLLRNVQAGQQSLDLLFGTFIRGKLEDSCLGVEGAGRVAMVFVSCARRARRRRLPDVHFLATEASPGAVAALNALKAAAWRRSIALLEALLPGGSSTASANFDSAGFRYLTELRYLRRDANALPCARVPAGDLTWVSYESGQEALFQEAVERTYAQSLDCPELTGLRPIREVLAGHRAVGVHDPALWWVALRGQKPAGVMLLSRISSGQAMEVVYMGVAQPVRRTGVADALLARAVAAAKNESAKFMALAVDERNTPARRMYARWGFVETASREAWIATPNDAPS